VGYGGGAGCGAVGHAAMAIATGAAECVVVWRARNRGSGGRPWAMKSNKERGDFQWFLPWGLSRPVDQIAMLARRHMIEFGSTQEQLGHVAVTFREHAQNKKNALMSGTPRKIQDDVCACWVESEQRVMIVCVYT